MLDISESRVLLQDMATYIASFGKHVVIEKAAYGAVGGLLGCAVCCTLPLWDARGTS